MGKAKQVCKLLTIPILTLALLVSSWMPGVDVGYLVSNTDFNQKTAVVEVYQGVQTVEAATNWDSTPKNYNVKVYIDNQNNELQFPEGMGKPFIAKDRTFVPYRIMCEALGAKVDWEAQRQKVTAEGNNSKVELYIGSTAYAVNGDVKRMDVEPFILSAEGRTYIPARYITEGLNYTIDFAQGNSVMYICSFTQGQTEAQRTAILQDIVKANEKPKTEIKNTAAKQIDVKWVRATSKEHAKALGWDTLELPELIIHSCYANIRFTSKTMDEYRFVCTSHDGLNVRKGRGYGEPIDSPLTVWREDTMYCMSLNVCCDVDFADYQIKTGDIIKYDIYDKAENLIYQVTFHQ